VSPIVITMRRTIGMARNLYATSLSVAAFLAVSAVLFVFGLARHEGGTLPLAAIWGAAVSPVLPALAALLAMDSWSDERQTGRIDMLLSVGVRERNFVLGKFFGVLTMLCASCVLFLISSIALLWWFAPASFANASVSGFTMALFVLFVQGALWCSVSVAASAMCRRAAMAACVSILFSIVLPRSVWAAMHELLGLGFACGEMPLDSMVVDVTSGLLCPGEIVSCCILTMLMLFVTSKIVMSFRLVGVGARGLVWSTRLSVLLAIASAVLSVMLVLRLDQKIDLPSVMPEAELSARTRRILQEANGEVYVTCFMSRKDVRFRQVGLLLRRFKRESEACGGLRLRIGFVDPAWDVGAAERLIGRGATENSLVFECGRRMVVLSSSEGWSERTCAAAIRRMFANPSRKSVYWTTGHGESGFDDYGSFGMSDIARDLVRDGYRNVRLDLSSGNPIPGDCALVMMVGVRHELSRMELGQLEAYLREGGRLMLLCDSSCPLGMSSLLSSLGVKVSNRLSNNVRSSGSATVTVSEFSDHEIAASMSGARIILENPVAFTRSVVADDVGTDHIEYLPIAGADGQTMVLALERGAKAGSDLAIRPMRIVVVGDAGLVMNEEISRRANANRDFFLNCIAYLSGMDVVASDGREAGVLVTGFNRYSRMWFVVCSSVAVPLVFLLLMLVQTWLRRRRR